MQMLLPDESLRCITVTETSVTLSNPETEEKKVHDLDFCFDSSNPDRSNPDM